MTTTTRIPADLQAIFLASNRGEEVHKPPPSAFRTFKKAFSKPFKRFQIRKNNKTPRSPRSPSSCTASSSFPSSLEFGDCELSHQGYNDQVNTQLTPQAWAEEVLPGRGYSTVHISAVATAYRNVPTELQLASFNAKTVALATCKRLDQVGPLRDILSCGISLNACNIHGETLMHKACRLGYHHILEVFIDLGAELRVCDAQGRTLMHDCCFGTRPSFQTFSLLMRHAPDLLFMADVRGACPLDYVRKDHYDFWIDYLDAHINRFWPCCAEIVGMHSKASCARNSRPIPNPANALTCDLASLVAAGRMKPDEALFLMRESTSSSDGDDCSLSDHEDDDDSDDDESECSFCLEDETELCEELGISLR